eukprot:scaffold43944_cov59-Attheya_sp.AAC.8
MSELLEKPYKTTVGSLEFAVGGASSEACLKTMTGKLISECVAGKKRMKEEDGSERPTKIARPNQRRVNTWHGGNDAELARQHSVQEMWLMVRRQKRKFASGCQRRSVRSKKHSPSSQQGTGDIVRISLEKKEPTVGTELPKLG